VQQAAELAEFERLSLVYKAFTPEQCKDWKLLLIDRTTTAFDARVQVTLPDRHAVKEIFPILRPANMFIVKPEGYASRMHPISHDDIDDFRGTEKQHEDIAEMDYCAPWRFKLNGADNKVSIYYCARFDLDPPESGRYLDLLVEAKLANDPAKWSPYKEEGSKDKKYRLNGAVPDYTTHACRPRRVSSGVDGRPDILVHWIDPHISYDDALDLDGYKKED
jgi:hypothetical protein